MTRYERWTDKYVYKYENTNTQMQTYKYKHIIANIQMHNILTQMIRTEDSTGKSGNFSMKRNIDRDDDDDGDDDGEGGQDDDDEEEDDEDVKFVNIFRPFSHLAKL